MPSDLISKLSEVGKRAIEQARSAQSLEGLQQVRVSFLGKKGELNSLLKALKDVDPRDRPKVGGAANEWKSKIEAELQNLKSQLEEKAIDASISNEGIDTTLPPRLAHLGALHPITQTMDLLVNVFARLGFDVRTGPEVETEFLNFDSMNIPADHPAREMQDTFFVEPGVVLRTHTSPVQMRTMLENPWPVRILSPGTVYRCDHDATHSPMFHQIEGLWVDRGIRMSDLIGVLDYFAKEVFGSSAEIRLRPSFFPFVEPGAEVDVRWKGHDWLEVLGAGMVHPNLFECAGYSKEEVSGFAFGIGIERIAMLLFGIKDMRLLFQNDVRFLKQFYSMN